MCPLTVRNVYITGNFTDVKRRLSSSIYLHEESFYFTDWICPLVNPNGLFPVPLIVYRLGRRVQVSDRPKTTLPTSYVGRETPIPPTDRWRGVDEVDEGEGPGERRLVTRGRR